MNRRLWMHIGTSVATFSIGVLLVIVWTLLLENNTLRLVVNNKLNCH